MKLVGETFTYTIGCPTGEAITVVYEAIETVPNGKSGVFVKWKCVSCEVEKDGKIIYHNEP